MAAPPKFSIATVDLTQASNCPEGSRVCATQKWWINANGTALFDYWSHARRTLERLAKYHGVTQKAIIQKLLIEAEHAAIDSAIALRNGQADYYDGKLRLSGPPPLAELPIREDQWTVVRNAGSHTRARKPGCSGIPDL